MTVKKYVNDGLLLVKDIGEKYMLVKNMDDSEELSQTSSS